MTGVNVRRIVLLAFVISAATSAIAGILLTSFNKVGAQYIGRGYDFAAITAVVVGGTTLAGGRGSILGVIGGVMVIGLLGSVLSLVRIGDFTFGEFEKQIVQGAVFILVVGANSYSRRKSGLGDD
jgi:ribose/xylose/arabinose/galactoside ABC-type transport system permease subunit